MTPSKCRVRAVNPEEVASAMITQTAFVHLIHYFGFALAVGASIAALRIHGMVRESEAPAKAALEAAARAIIVKIEIPGQFLAMFGGLVAIVLNPNLLKPALSGAGPWLHIKLLLVLILLVVAHLRMFRSARLVRERAGGASEAELDALLGKALMFGKIDLVLAVLIFVLATFRYVLFG